MCKKIALFALFFGICFSTKFSLAFSCANSVAQINSKHAGLQDTFLRDIENADLLKILEKELPADLTRTEMKYDEGYGGGGGGGGAAAGLGGKGGGSGGSQGKAGQVPKGGHNKNVRPSTKGKHERGDARRQKEQKKAEEKKQKNKKKK
jgi:hypothetical protein